MPAAILLFVLMWGAPLNLAFAEEPGKKSFDIQKPTPEHEADLRKAFMAQVSRDLASRKERVISRHMFLSDFIAEQEQQVKADTSQGDTLRQKRDQRGYWNPKELEDFKRVTDSEDTYSRLIDRAEHEQHLLIQQYRLLTQLEELEDGFRKKDITKGEYLHLKTLVAEALMRTSQSLFGEDIALGIVGSLNNKLTRINAGLRDITRELSFIGQRMPASR
jgi:hypothetical protein